MTEGQHRPGAEDDRRQHGRPLRHHDGLVGALHLAAHVGDAEGPDDQHEDAGRGAEGVAPVPGVGHRRSRGLADGRGEGVVGDRVVLDGLGVPVADEGRLGGEGQHEVEDHDAADDHADHIEREVVQDLHAEGHDEEGDEEADHRDGGGTGLAGGEVGEAVPAQGLAEGAQRGNPQQAGVEEVPVELGDDRGEARPQGDRRRDDARVVDVLAAAAWHGAAEDAPDERARPDDGQHRDADGDHQLGPREDREAEADDVPDRVDGREEGKAYPQHVPERKPADESAGLAGISKFFRHLSPQSGWFRKKIPLSTAGDSSNVVRAALSLVQRPPPFTLRKTKPTRA